ncbi:class I SAM-dependent methyltransferase [Hoeflea sp. CAU 1731]
MSSRNAGNNPFDKGGSDYARFRPTYPQALIDALADLCGSTRHALDVGCGNGQFSCLLAIRFDRVTATDPSAEQIENAFQDPKVDYRQESAETIGLTDDSVDLIVAAQAAHWFDLDAFYAEAKRVARPGAVVALVSYGVPELDGEVGKRFHDFYWTEIFDYWPAARRHVEDGYATMPFPFPELALPDIAIERQWTLGELLGYISTWSAVKAARKAGADAVIDAFAKDLKRLWGPEETLRTIRWPINGRVGRIE